MLADLPGDAGVDLGDFPRFALQVAEDQRREPAARHFTAAASRAFCGVAINWKWLRAR